MRLTKKDYCGYDIKNRKSNTDYTCEEIFDVVQKLGKLEDLEEELGCPLEILYKILKNGYIYTRNKKKYLNTIALNRENKHIIVSDDELGMINRFNVSLSDYKKYWFLKKDKSEENE